MKLSFFILIIIKSCQFERYFYLNKNSRSTPEKFEKIWLCDQTGWWRRVSGALASGSWVTLPRLIWRRRLVNFSQRFTPSTSILSTLCLTTCVTGLLLTFIGGGTAQLGTLVHRPSLHVHVSSTTLGTLTATKQTISWAKFKLLDPELKNRVPKIVTAYMTYSWNIWLLNVTA